MEKKEGKSSLSSDCSSKKKESEAERVNPFGGGRKTMRTPSTNDVKTGKIWNIFLSDEEELLNSEGTIRIVHTLLDCFLLQDRIRIG